MTQTEKDRVASGGQKTFLTVWLGLMVSWSGSHLTGFALGVTVFQDTQSVTQYAIVLFATLTPEVLLSPLAGALSDRFDRRIVLLLSEAGGAICGLVIIYLAVNGLLHFWPIVIVVSIRSACKSFQFPAFNASTTLLVPPKNLARAAGLVQLGIAAGELVAPAASGFLLLSYGLEFIVLIDVASFGFCLISLMLIRLPKPRLSEAGEEAKGTIWQEALYGWTYIKRFPGLLGLLVFFGVVNFNLGAVTVLITPLVLGFADADVLGMTLSTGGMGMLFGSILMLTWGGPKRHIHGVLLFSIVQGMVLFLAAANPSAWLVAAGAFGILFTMPIINSSNQAIWQRKVETDVQGRVYAIRNVVGTGAYPLAYLVAGPLADHIFEPLMRVDGPLAGSVGALIGTGPGRGIAFFFILLGISTLTMVAWAYSNSHLRRVEIELPDRITDEEESAPGTNPNEVGAQGLA